MFYGTLSTLSAGTLLLPLVADADSSGFGGMWIVFLLVIVILALIAGMSALGLRYIPNDRVGVVEKMWSNRGSVTEGHIIAVNGEAGFQANLLRGGYHLWLWPWQFR